MSDSPAWRFRLVIGLFLSFLASSCGGSSSSSSTPSNPAPTAPTGVPVDVVNMAGTWVGTIETPDSGVQPVTMTVVQFANCVDGTWRSRSGDWRGAISGFARQDSFAGQVSIERDSCQGIADVTGPVGSDTIQWMIGDVKPFLSCNGAPPESVVLSLRRQ